MLRTPLKSTIFNDLNQSLDLGLRHADIPYVRLQNALIGANYID